MIVRYVLVKSYNQGGYDSEWLRKGARREIIRNPKFYNFLHCMWPQLLSIHAGKLFAEAFIQT